MQTITFVVHSAEWLLFLLLSSVIAISLMPRDNPLRELLTCLCRKLAVTIGLAVVAVPVEFIPFVDLAYDVAAPLYLAFSWFGFVKDAIALDSPLRKKQPPAAPVRRSAEPVHMGDVEVIDAVPTRRRLSAPQEQRRAATVHHEDAQDSYF